MEVSKKGLYYRFCCNCRFQEKRKYSIVAKCGDKSVSLGICIPYGNAFGFETSVPIKRFGAGDMSFNAVVTEKAQFHPIASQKPFDHIPELRKAKFAVRDGQAGVIITEKSLAQ